MKKQSKKLNISKKTITNLDSNQMNEKVGGDRTNGRSCNTLCWTQKGNTCHNNCGSF